MNTLSRWIAPLVVAAGLGLGVAPVTAHAQDDLIRVLVDVADVVIRGGTPYYRYGDYGYDDRLYVQRDRYGRPLYYRSAPRYTTRHRGNPPYGHAYGHRKQKCNKHGKCRIEYYDPRYDRDRYVRYDRRHWDDRRRWDDRRWDRDDD